MSMTRSTATQKASMEQVLRHPRKLDPHLLGILLLEIRRLDCECRECFVDHSTQSSVQHSHRLYHLTTVFSSEPHTDIQKHPHITADSASPVTWHHSNRQSYSTDTATSHTHHLVISSCAGLPGKKGGFLYDFIVDKSGKEVCIN